MTNALDIPRHNLKSPDPSIREEALDRIGDLNPPEAFELIKPLASDSDASVRGAVACNLGSIRDSRSVPILLHFAENDPSNEVKAEAIASLSSYRDPQILLFLLRYAWEKELGRRVRQEIAKQLGNYNSEAAADALRTLTTDKDAFVRDFALASLRRIAVFPEPGANYQQLEKVYSRLLMDGEASFAAGAFSAAAYYWMQAGESRISMAKMSVKTDAGEGILDLITAARCFLKSTVIQRAETTVKMLIEFRDNGAIAIERSDLLIPINTCKEEYAKLEQQIQSFLRGFGERELQLEMPDQGTEDFLLDYLPVLPGYSRLHYAIFRQASMIDHPIIAAEHLVWAASFDSSNPNLAALLGYAFVSQNMHEQAVKLGRDFLDLNPIGNAPVRIMVALALSSKLGAPAKYQIEALEILAPVIADEEADRKQKIIAVAIAAACEAELRHEEGFIKWRNQLQALEKADESKGTHSIASVFRTILPGSETTDPSVGRFSQFNHERFFQSALRVCAPSINSRIASYMPEFRELAPRTVPTVSVGDFMGSK